MALADLRGELLAAVDAVFAERVRLSFLVDGAVDPTRPAVEISAKLRVREAEGSNARREGGRWNAYVAAGKSRLSVNRLTYEGPDVRTGDRVCALDRPGRPWFEVARIDDRDAARLHLELNET